MERRLRMATETQTAANHTNAQKSTGPRGRNRNTKRTQFSPQPEANQPDPPAPVEETEIPNEPNFPLNPKPINQIHRPPWKKQKYQTNPIFPSTRSQSTRSLAPDQPNFWWGRPPRSEEHTSELQSL